MNLFILIHWYLTLIKQFDLSSAGSGNQLFSDPLRFSFAGFTHRPRDFVIFRRWQPCGNKLPTLLFFGKRRPANIAGFAHKIRALILDLFWIRRRGMLRQRYQIQLVFFFRCFHTINVTLLLSFVNYICVTFIRFIRPIFKSSNVPVRRVFEYRPLVFENWPKKLIG